MARLIDADELGRFAFHIKQSDGHERCVVDWDDIENAPTVDAQPVVHGRWETVPNREVEHGEVVIRGTAELCTHCRHASKYYRKDFNRCPNCGAKMDGGDSRENI